MTDNGYRPGATDVIDHSPNNESSAAAPRRRARESSDRPYVVVVQLCGCKFLAAWLHVLLMVLESIKIL